MKKFSILVLLLPAAGTIMSGVSMISAQAGQRAGLAVISGKVKDVIGAGVKGATVTVESQGVKATTNSDGSFKIADVNPGQVCLYVKTPVPAYLDGETLKSISVKNVSTVSGVEIVLSSRPGVTATYVGMRACSGCRNAGLSKSLDGTPHAAAHSRFVTEGTSHMVYRITGVPAVVSARSIDGSV